MEGVDNIDEGREVEKGKWKGKARAEVKGAGAEKVWPLLEDFFGLDKWFPTLTTCIPVEGISGQPGCVRFCAGFKTPVDHDAKPTLNWTKQKLLSIDPTNWTFSYSIVDGNVGFHSYVSTLKLLPKPHDQGCEIEWFYQVEPVLGWKLDYLHSFIDTGLQIMAQRMQAALNTMEQALTASQ
ncbi:Lachrymatory-factor synthase, partial [Mucuna pruriens]